MHDTFIIYPPGAGGNHLKNLLCLSEAYVNSSELDPTVYDAQNRAPGEVWCVGGRNLQQVFFDRIHANPGTRSVLIAHFGELAQNHAEFDRVQQPQLVIITLRDANARRRLEHRHHRLGQTIHPYWLDEELIWCYQQRLYTAYFDVPSERCLELDISDFWQPDFCASAALEGLQRFLSVTVPREQAQILHHKWMHSNFGSGTDFHEI